MLKAKKILINGLNFSPEIVGIGKYTTELVEYLHENDCNVNVICACPYFPEWRTEKNIYSIEKKKDFYKIYRCPIYLPKKINGFNRILHLLSFYLSSFPIILFQYFWKPDVIITIVPSFFSTQNSLFLSFLMRFKVTTLVHYQDLEIDAAFEMGILKNKFLKKIIYLWERITLSKFDYISSISENMIKKLSRKNLDKKKLYYLPNWVDTKQIFPHFITNNSYKKQFNIPENKIIFMYSGSMNQKQGVEILAELATYDFNNKNIFWIFAGEGPSKKILLEKTKNKKNVLITTLQPPERMNEWLNLADVHIIPQKDEASDLVLPSKLITILASGKPFIVTTSPKTQLGKIASEAGILVFPYSNFYGLVDAVEKLANDDSLRKKLGKKARDLAIQKYDKEEVLCNFLKFIQSLN